ncbi:MAG TPA: serine/threonine-protein kinase [Chloroflexota bacterium]
METCLHCGQLAGNGRFCPNCGIARASAAERQDVFIPSLWQPLPVSLQLASRYKVRRLVSRGSFGAVYEAEDSRFEGQVRALKELVPVVLQADELEEATAWFLREAELLATLNHPAIPRVWDSFEEHGRLYIVMQFIKGRTLEQILTKRPESGLPAATVIGWARALCDVLEYLHARTPPVLFRDLKPANIMVDDDGNLMLIDFGIATRFVPRRVGTTIGTPGYAPPEQYQGLAEPRSDLYALAATLHHLLTGRDPAREAPFSFPALDAEGLGIPASLGKTIAASLAFVATERPPSVKLFRTALRAAPPNTPRASGSQVIRSDLRHASRVANQPWSPSQSEVVAAVIPRQAASMQARFQVESVETAGEEYRVEALRLQGERLAHAGHFAKAESVLDQALTLCPDDADLWRDKGYLLRQAGRPREAIAAFKETLRLAPDQADVLSTMGWCLGHIGLHPEALATLEQALVLEPHDAGAWAARGWSLACQHRYQEALRALDEATQLDPMNAEAWRTRGYCLQRLGQDGEAMRSFRRAQRAG